MENHLNIAINAQLAPNGGTGGVESVVLGLVAALGRLEGPERYQIVCRWDEEGWLAGHLGPNQRIVRGPGGPRPRLVSALFGAARKSGIATRLWREYVERPRKLRPPISDGFFESLGCEVVHFPYQIHQICAVPTVFNPHDLQHCHLPQFFTAEEIVERDFRYRTGCQHAAVVVAGSNWVKRDVMAQYGISEEKVQVIPWAAPTQVHAAPEAERVRSVAAKWGLERPYFYYPAMTWPHKNHLRLLDAFSRLIHETNADVDLVCTGLKKESFWPQIEARIRDLGLGERTRFLGMVPRDEIRCLYRGATAVIVPTLFEAASGPVFEAWADDAPVACSNVTSLPEQVADAALVFDPYSVDAVFDAMCRLQGDAALREKLVAAGRKRLADFDWEKTARAYRAVYRKIARRALTEEDIGLLSMDWMSQPQRARQEG